MLLRPLRLPEQSECHSPAGLAEPVCLGPAEGLGVFAAAAAAGQMGNKLSPLQLSGGRAVMEKTGVFLDARGFPSSYVII